MSRRPTKKGNGGDGESSSPVAQARQGDAGNEDDVSTGVWRALRSSAAAAAAVNVVGFTITAISRTHKITDLCGTAGFVVSAAATLTMRNAKGVHGKPALAWLLAAAVAMWAIRLGTFLLVRVLRVGSDWRLEPFFADVNPENGLPFPLSLMGFWSIQALWAFVTLLPVSVVHGIATAGPSRRASLSINPVRAAGLVAALVGFVVESTADAQKDAAKSASPDTWVSVGLWSVARHPNYFGEMLFWFGVAVAALAHTKVVSRFAWASLAPISVAALLLFVSGVPFLEKRNEAKYGGQAEWEAYKANTNLLWPFDFP